MGGQGEDGAAAGVAAGAAEVAAGAEGAATQPKWCEVNTPFMEDQKASGVAWLDEPKKYGPPLVAIFGLKDVDAGEGRKAVGDGSIADAVAYLQTCAYVVPSEVLQPLRSVFVSQDGLPRCRFWQ